jgi:bacterial/archaeal transporter family-2 protein
VLLRRGRRGAYSVLGVSSTAVAAVLALAAGLGGAVQIAVQGRLGERVGSFEALATASLIGAALALAVLLLARRSLSGIGDALGAPKWMLLGGVMSALIILAITVAGPRIGIVATTSVLIAAQFALATVIDRFGWFGVERIAVSWTRVIGLAFLCVGAALVLRR